MKKTLDTLLKTVLTSEQFAAFKEEVSSGIKKVNSMVEDNEKIKAKKELVVEISKKIDDMIEKSEKSPVLFKALYSSVKETAKKMILPFIEEGVEEEGYEDLDDVPDVPVKEIVKKKPAPVVERKKQNNPKTTKTLSSSRKDSSNRKQNSSTKKSPTVKQNSTVKQGSTPKQSSKKTVRRPSASKKTTKKQ